MKQTAAHIFMLSWAWLGLGMLYPLQAQQYEGAEGFYFNHLYENYPGFRASHESLERQVQQYIANHYNQRDVDGQVFTIPVVIHIVHLPKDTFPVPGTSNPPLDQVERGLEWLNDIFRNTNLFAGGPDFTNATNLGNLRDSSRVPRSVDTKIEFCLARSDDQGNLISGIYRTASQWSNININNLGEVPAGYFPEPYLLNWDTEAQNTKQCLNIWLVNKVCEDIRQGCEIEGFAYPPAWSDSVTDGVVIENAYWGTSIDSQAAAAFYVGQYLGLFPTYHELICPSGDTSQAISCLSHGDKVCDTPPDNSPGGPACGLGTTPNPVNTCTTDAFLLGGPFKRDVQDMITNYMDWGFAPGCHNTFTLGQANRMRAVLSTSRLGLRLSQRCAIPFKNLSVIGVESPNLVDCGQRIYPTVVVYNSGNQPIRDIQVAFKDDAGHDTSERWKGGVLNPGDTLKIPFLRSISGFAPGMYQGEAYIKLVDLKSSDGDPADDVLSHKFWILEPGFPVSTYPYCADMSGGSLPPYWQKVDLDGRLTFDGYNQANCQDVHGDFVLRYNSSGQFNNGQGQGADPRGTRDLLVSPVIDLQDQEFNWLKFQFAHKYLDGPRGLKCRVLALSECGKPLGVLWDVKGRNLETSSTPDDFQLVGWEPQSCSDWDSVALSLERFSGLKVRIAIELQLEGTHTQNFYLDNICIAPQPPCERPNYIPSAPGEYFADKVCTNDSTGWVHFIKSAELAPQSSEDLLLFSYLDTGANKLNISPEFVRMVLTPSYQNGGHDLTGKATYVENLKGWHAMARYVIIDQNVNLSGPVPVRLYFDRFDVDDMAQAISPANLTQEENLVFCTIDQASDNLLEDEHRLIDPQSYTEFRHVSQPGERSWTMRQFDNYFGVQLEADHFSYFGGGTGGYGLAMGARYPVMPYDIIGRLEDGGVLIDWKTKREWQMGRFEVYHSTDRQFFEQVDELQTPGFFNASTQYTYLHETPADGMNYYYIKLAHENGVELVTDTLAVFFDPGKVIRVFPNPAKDLLQVGVDAPVDTEIRFTLKNGQNQHILDQYWRHEGGPHPIDVRHMTPGMYFYTVNFNDIELWGKLVLKP